MGSRGSRRSEKSICQNRTSHRTLVLQEISWWTNEMIDFDSSREMSCRFGDDCCLTSAFPITDSDSMPFLTGFHAGSPKAHDSSKVVGGKKIPQNKRLNVKASIYKNIHSPTPRPFRVQGSVGCADIGNCVCEALTGEDAGQVLSHKKTDSGCRLRNRICFMLKPIFWTDQKGLCLCSMFQTG